MFHSVIYYYYCMQLSSPVMCITNCARNKHGCMLRSFSFWLLPGLHYFTANVLPVFSAHGVISFTMGGTDISCCQFLGGHEIHPLEKKQQLMSMA